MATETNNTDPSVEARRRFLASCGRFAAATPPAMALILADAEHNPLFALSGGSSGGGGPQGNNGFGNGGGDGIPGNSGSAPGMVGGDINR